MKYRVGKTTIHQVYLAHKKKKKLKETFDQIKEIIHPICAGAACSIFIQAFTLDFKRNKKRISTSMYKLFLIMYLKKRKYI